MEKLLKSGNKHKISNACFDNNITKISNKLAKQHMDSNIEIIHVPIYLDLLFKAYIRNNFNLNDMEEQFKKLTYNSPLHILNLWCSYYEGYENKQDTFIHTLNKYIKQNKNIFVYFDLHDYLIDDESLKTGKLTYSIHSTCCLIYPDKNNKS